MSLAIDIDHVTAVLLTAGWHDVANNSFTLDSYEYVWYAGQRARQNDDPEIVHGGGNSSVCSTGFSFTTDDGSLIGGPLSAIQAVRYTDGET